MTLDYQGFQSYHPTTDDWHPCYSIQKEPHVRVRVMKLFSGFFRVCVWGADDYGMEYDTSSQDEAFQLYRELLFTKAITIADLKSRGFITA
jgi:hypothetical protein